MTLTATKPTNCCFEKDLPLLRIQRYLHRLLKKFEIFLDSIYICDIN